MSDTTSGADILARIKPQLREESTQIVMGSPLLAEWETMQEKLLESRAKDMEGNRLADGESQRTRDLAAKIVELEDQMQAMAVDVTFRAMSKDKWRALCDNNPPRANDQLDAFAGYNRDAVLDQSVRICMVQPVFTDCATQGCEHTDCGSWQHFESVLSAGEWQELKDTVNTANRGVVDAPKSALASRILARRATD